MKGNRPEPTREGLWPQKVLDDLQISIPLIGIAKKREELFFPHQSQPLILSHQEAPLQLIQRIRDEAHRFAISYHRLLRKKEMEKARV